MTKRLPFTLVLTLFLASGCNLIFKQSIQQGNALEQEDLDKLRIGMSMNQVSFLLGTPSIQDPFHHNRWDYVSSFSRRGDDPVTRKVTLYFENGALSEMIGVESDEFIFEDEPTENRESPDASEQLDEMVEQPSEAAAESAQAEVTALTTPAAEQSAYDAGTGADPAAIDASAPAASITEATEPANAAAVDAAASEPAKTDPPTSAEGASGWAIQLGAFDTERNARLVLERLQSAGYAADIAAQDIGGGNLRYLVRQAGISTRQAAETLLSDIRDELGINGFLIPPAD